MKCSSFIFDQVHLLYYNPSLDRSYIDSPDWIKNKRVINPINKNDNKCFQYTTTLALNNGKIRKDSGRITKIKPFIDKYKWEE